MCFGVLLAVALGHDWDLQPDGQHHHQRLMSICFWVVILLIGMEHTVSILCCQCEPLGVTLVHARLWPATAQNPNLAFTFDLLDWAEALMYKCQVALKDLWGALQYKFPYILIKVGCCV